MKILYFTLLSKPLTRWVCCSVMTQLARCWTWNYYSFTTVPNSRARANPNKKRIEYQTARHKGTNIWRTVCGYGADLSGGPYLRMASLSPL